MSSSSGYFDYSPRTRIVFGENTIDNLGKLIREIGKQRALLVTDPGIVKAGHVERALASLHKVGLEGIIFDEVRENPSTKDVQRCLEATRNEAIDVFIGLGGGSSLDTAKGCNLILTNGGRIEDYWGWGKACKPMLPMIAIPTTAGTGSETQSFALIAKEKNHQKMACGDPKITPQIAILDPILTLSQPKHVARCTGIDAITHAIESFVTKKRNPISNLFAKESLRLTACNFEKVLQNPEKISARQRMLLGASYAGIAIENSMLGAAHAAANPLTAHYGIVHGKAVGIMLPQIIKFNSEFYEIKKLYSELAIQAGISGRNDRVEDSTNNLISWTFRLLEVAGLQSSLATHGVKKEMISTLAQEAASQWTAGCNPRKIQSKEFEKIYEKTFEYFGI